MNGELPTKMRDVPAQTETNAEPLGLEAMREALEYALGSLRTIAGSHKSSTPGQLAAVAQAGIDLATLGSDQCAEMRGDAAALQLPEAEIQSSDGNPQARARVAGLEISDTANASCQSAVETRPSEANSTAAEAGLDWPVYDDGEAPWSEDEQFEERRKACKARTKKFGECGGEGDYEGQCDDCDYDAQDVLRKKYRPAPASSQPVVGVDQK